ncbi:hypothetical protein SLS56_002540 [Neofusicoccum ribis]|uniref:Uncharacterized protein n=1 Tax=Neofusicoccum ribis TaxID=45134 RepID=A0ABR3T323_9PEZI
MLVAVPTGLAALWALFEKMYGRPDDAAATLPAPVTHHISNSNVNAPLARVFIGYNRQSNHGYHPAQTSELEVSADDAVSTTQQWGKQ